MSLEDHAKELAEKRIDNILRVKTPENVLAVYLAELTRHLKIPKELVYSKAAAEQLWETHQREAKTTEKLKCIKEITEKNEAVKRIFLDNAYAEHSATIYKTAAQLFGRKDDAIYPVGNDAPRRIDWNKTIKDTNPKSSLRYNLKDWVDGLSLFEHWDINETKMLFNLKKAFLNREIPIAYLDDIKANYRWIVKITVRFEGEAG